MPPRLQLAVAAATSALAALLTAPLAACSVDEGYPPVARMTATPRAIPENDGFMSPVVLDATMSADPIDDPEGRRPLRYRWQLIGDEYRVEGGALDEATVTISLLGEKPLTVQLTVTDGDGQATTVTEQLQLTVMP